MSLAPFALAVFFGLLISALLYFVLIWPSREPAEDAEAPAAGAPGLDDRARASRSAVVDRPAGKRAGKRAGQRADRRAEKKAHGPDAASRHAT